MANLFKKIYTGALSQFVALATKDANALYLLKDNTTNVKSIYKGDTKVAGDFVIVNGAEPKDNIELGVIYYISEFGKDTTSETPKEGHPFVGFWDGTKWVSMSDSADITALQYRVSDLEDATVIDGNTVEGSIGEAVETLIGDEDVEGSVKEQVATAKAAIEGELKDGDATTLAALNTKIEGAIDNLDYEDEETVGDVVVAVSQKDGVIAVDKQTMSVAKVADDDLAEGMAAEYQIMIGEHALETKISVPFANTELTNTVLSDMNATVDEETGAITAGDPKGDDALIMVFKMADGSFKGVKVNVETFLDEAEFKSGLKVDNHEVSINLVDNNNYLKFGTPKVEGKNAPLEANVVTIANAHDATEGADAVTGLADVLDVKTVIEANEKVTASALNDLNTRIGNTNELTTEAKVVVPAINELKSALEDKNVEAEGETGDDALVTASAADNKVTVETTEKLQNAVALAETSIQSVVEGAEGQEVTVAVEDIAEEGNTPAGKEVTISVTKASYTAAEFNEDGTLKTDGTLVEAGLVDGTLLKAYIADEIAKNAVYWLTL